LIYPRDSYTLPCSPWDWHTPPCHARELDLDTSAAAGAGDLNALRLALVPLVL